MSCGAISFEGINRTKVVYHQIKYVFKIGSCICLKFNRSLAVWIDSVKWLLTLYRAFNVHLLDSDWHLWVVGTAEKSWPLLASEISEIHFLFVLFSFFFINKLIVLYSVKSASVWIICTTPRHQKETSWGGSAQGTQGSLLGVFWVRCSRDVLPGEGHSKQIISLSLAWQHLSVPLDYPEEVAGKREVWDSLIRLLPQSLTWDKCKKMDGRMWYKMKETSLHH